MGKSKSFKISASLGGKNHGQDEKKKFFFVFIYLNGFSPVLADLKIAEYLFIPQSLGRNRRRRKRKSRSGELPGAPRYSAPIRRNPYNGAPADRPGSACAPARLRACIRERNRPKAGKP